jgi:hypothetical protein
MRATLASTTCSSRRRRFIGAGGAEVVVAAAVALAAMRPRSPETQAGAGAPRRQRPAAVVVARGAGRRRGSRTEGTLRRPAASLITLRNPRSAAATCRRCRGEGGRSSWTRVAWSSRSVLLRFPLCRCSLPPPGHDGDRAKILRARIGAGSRSIEESTRTRIRRPGRHLLRQQSVFRPDVAGAPGVEMRTVAGFAARSRRAAAGPSTEGPDRGIQIVEANVNKAGHVRQQLIFRTQPPATTSSSSTACNSLSSRWR